MSLLRQGRRPPPAPPLPPVESRRLAPRGRCASRSRIDELARVSGSICPPPAMTELGAVHDRAEPLHDALGEIGRQPSRKQQRRNAKRGRRGSDILFGERRREIVGKLVARSIMRRRALAGSGSCGPDPFQNSVNRSIASSTDPFQRSSETSRATCANAREAAGPPRSRTAASAAPARSASGCAPDARTAEHVAILNAIAPP